MNTATLQNLTSFKEKLNDIRAEERLRWEKDKEAFREEEKALHASARSRMAEAVEFLQNEALSTFTSLLPVVTNNSCRVFW